MNTKSQLLQMMQNKSEAYWERIRKEHQLNLFHSTARYVPAYRDFLTKHKISPEKIKTFQDLKQVPPINKNNYLRQYPWTDLLNVKKKHGAFTLAATSGSSGVPFYFPRDERLDLHSTVFHLSFLQQDPKALSRKTLVIDGFGMGVWIGGILTYSAFKQIADDGYPFFILTPGSNKKEIIDSLEHIGKNFEQIILCGYPPFIKDIADECEMYGIEWGKFKVKIVFAAETFSEKFRSYITQKFKIKNPYVDTMSVYGSADLGTMAIETAASIAIRALALKSTPLLKELFPTADRLPTLAQFNPTFVNFESQDGEILCSGENTLPLVRYQIGDHGGILTHSQISKIFDDYGLHLDRVLKKNTSPVRTSRLPFVYVYERSDFSTKLCGAIIYPEHVKEALQERILNKYVTGKFTMLTKVDKMHNQYLEINIESKSGAKIGSHIKQKTTELITKNLLKKNAEYSYLANLLPTKVEPKVVFWPNGHPTYFKNGVKQAWIKK